MTIQIPAVVRRRGCRSTRGFTIMEATISFCIFVILSLLAVSGMIIFAKASKSQDIFFKIIENARRFVQTVDTEAGAASNVQVLNNGTLLRLTNPDGTTIEYEYQDDDTKNTTIADNRVIRRQTGQPTRTMLTWCSKVTDSKMTDNPAFTLDAAAPVALVHVLVRSGDRIFAGDPTDDAITGPGFQSFVIRATVMSGAGGV